MGRTVYAVPGGIDRPTSIGCNRLIQQGAKLVMNAGEVLDDLMTLFPAMPRVSKHDVPTVIPAVTLTSDEQAIYELLSTEPMQIDEITAQTQLSSPTVAATLMRLEMKRLARPLPGLRYVRHGG